ncbi:hypothetical protein [Paenibacillus sp. P36]
MATLRKVVMLSKLDYLAARRACCAIGLLGGKEGMLSNWITWR